MTHATNGHSTNPRLLEGRDAASDPERVLLELRVELLACIDAALGQIGSMAAVPPIGPAALREEPLGRRLRRSVLFGEVDGA